MSTESLSTQRSLVVVLWEENVSWSGWHSKRSRIFTGREGEKDISGGTSLSKGAGPGNITSSCLVGAQGGDQSTGTPSVPCKGSASYRINSCFLFVLFFLTTQRDICPMDIFYVLVYFFRRVQFSGFCHIH